VLKKLKNELLRNDKKGTTVKPVYLTSSEQQRPVNNNQPIPQPTKNISNFIGGTSE
jgi:hypothetical protein